MIAFYRWAFAALLLLGSGGVFSQALPVPATDPIPRVQFPISPVGNISKFGPRTADASNAAKFSFGAASNGAVFANTTSMMPTAGGASIPVGVSGSIAKPNVSAALGRFARKQLPLLSTGVALYDLAEELGFGLDNSGGSLLISKFDPNACTGSSNCTRWYSKSAPSLGNFLTANAACQAAVPYLSALLGLQGYTYADTNNGGYNCNAYKNGVKGLFTELLPRSVPPVPSAYVPQTQQQFEDAITAKSDWSPASALARATRDAILSGESLDVVPQSLTGPAYVPGTSSELTDPVDGTRTKIEEKYEFTYAPATPSEPASVVTTKRREVTALDPATGVPLSPPRVEVESPVSPGTPEPLPFDMPCGVAGKPPCDVKVDESGVPDPDTIRIDQADNALQDWDNFQGNIADVLPKMPTIAWDFALPTGCDVISLPAFEPYLPSLDVCQFQPMFHQIMGVVWMLGGLFGAISLFMRSSLSVT